MGREFTRPYSGLVSLDVSEPGSVHIALLGRLNLLLSFFVVLLYSISMFYFSVTAENF